MRNDSAKKFRIQKSEFKVETLLFATLRDLFDWRSFTQSNVRGQDAKKEELKSRIPSLIELHS